jgi:hypothetical protein
VIAWLSRLHERIEAHDTALTILLLFVALLLVIVAIQGKPSHKAMALSYVVSP